MTERDPNLVASIIILGWNQVEYTRMCVESVQRYTDVPYELILVDNGSHDGTADYFRSVPSATVIVNEANRGFAGGNNQGIEAARGEYVVLLNNDTIITKGWLRRLIAHAAADVGLVGPMSNYVATRAQRVAAEYTLEQLQKFAVLHARKHADEAVRTDFLSGFCWLVRREVFERIGLLDEKFALGGYEDNDFCRRAAGAGYALVLARDVFIHHFGSKSFEGNRLDRSRIQDENGRLFAEKWGCAVRSADDTHWILPELLERATDHVLRHEPLQALNCLRMHLSRFPRDHAVLGSAGRILRDLGRYEEAAYCLSRAAQAAPEEVGYQAEWADVQRRMQTEIPVATEAAS
jgi:GT2 family glycosyltransferase